MNWNIRTYWREKRTIGRNVKAYGLALSVIGFMAILVSINPKGVYEFLFFAVIPIIALTVITVLIAEFFKSKMP